VAECKKVINGMTKRDIVDAVILGKVPFISWVG